MPERRDNHRGRWESQRCSGRWHCHLGPARDKLPEMLQSDRQPGDDRGQVPKENEYEEDGECAMATLDSITDKSVPGSSGRFV
jgi:hypothetical protein